MSRCGACSRFSVTKRVRPAVEYGLILAFIFLAMAVGVTAVGTSTKNMWDNVASSVLGA